MKTFAFALFPAVSLAALGSAVQNDVVGGGGCKAMTVLFARGTTELGNMGSVAGPPFVTALGAMMGGSANVAVQGIEYPADIPGFLVGGDKAGSARMAKMVGQVRAACPDTALVMAGYSYVLALIHNIPHTFGTNSVIVREANSCITPQTCSRLKTQRL
jgi:cutinase